MKFTKIKYNALSGLYNVKAFYKKLMTKDTFIYISIIIIIVLAFKFQFAKVDNYRQDRHLKKLSDTVIDLTNGIEKKDSLITQYEDEHIIIKEFVKEVFSSNYYINSVTGYHPVVEQCDATPDITADGTKIDIERAGDYRYVALSRDLLRHFNRRGADIEFGDYVLIKGTPGGVYDGLYQVRDTMNKRHTEWIDILLTPGEQSFYYKNILMYKITREEYLKILKDVYNHSPDIPPVAMLEPEV